MLSCLQESLAPKIKDLDVGKDWVSSRCTVAVKELKAEWSTSQRSQVPGMSAEQGLALADTQRAVAALNSLQRGDDP